MTLKEKCAKCHKVVNKDFLTCKLCESICHAKCAGISENTIREINPISNICWNCDDCLNSYNFDSFTRVNEKISLLDTKMDTLFENLKLRFDNIESTFKNSSSCSDNLLSLLNNKADCIIKDMQVYSAANADIINNLVENVNANLNILSNKQNNLSLPKSNNLSFSNPLCNIDIHNDSTINDNNLNNNAHCINNTTVLNSIATDLTTNTDNNNPSQDGFVKHHNRNYLKALKRKRSENNDNNNFPSYAQTVGPGPKTLLGQNKNKNCDIKAAPKLPNKAFLYLGGVDPNIQLTQLKNYLTQQNVNILNLYSLNTNYKTLNISQSFKITIFKYDYNKIMNASLWPEGVILKDWVNYRKPTNTRGNDNPESSEPSSKRSPVHSQAPLVSGSPLPSDTADPNTMDNLNSRDKLGGNDIMSVDPAIISNEVN